MKPPMDDRVRNGRDSLNADDVPQPEPFQRRQIQAAHALSQVPERVRALVAVLRRVGQRAHAARVHHDHRRTSHCAEVMSRPTFAILKG
jgi:hypothetical protein